MILKYMRRLLKTSRWRSVRSPSYMTRTKRKLKIQKKPLITKIKKVRGQGLAQQSKEADIVPSVCLMRIETAVKMKIALKYLSEAQNKCKRAVTFGMKSKELTVSRKLS